jgi:hypothetical protein
MFDLRSAAQPNGTSMKPEATDRSVDLEEQIVQAFLHSLIASVICRESNMPLKDFHF